MIKKKIFNMVLLIVPCLLLTPIICNGEWIYRNVNEEFMSPGSSTYSQKILSSSAGVLEGAGTVKALIYGKYNNNNSSNRLATFWRGTDKKLYGYVPKAGSNVRFAYRKYTYLGVFANTGFENLTTNQMGNGIPEDNKFTADTYYNNNNFNGKVTRFAYYMDSSTSLRYSFCRIFDSLNTSICIFNIEGYYDELGTSATASNNYTPPITGLSHIPADFSNDLIGTSPRTSNAITPTPSKPNTHYYCPKISQLLENYGKNYNTGLCYNNTLIFNNETLQFETVEKQDIFTIFNNDYTTFTNRRSIYNSNCNTPYTQQNCNNAFSGENIKLNIFNNMYSAKVDEKNLWNYCYMALNYDPNATTCTISGGLQQQPTREEILNDILNGNYTIVTPNTGNVFDNLLTGDQTRATETERDVFGAMDRIYTKITGLFKDRKGVKGIIPEYIMRICYLSILFIVLFKKG